MTAIPSFIFAGGISVSAFSFLGFGLTLYPEIMSPKN